MPIPLLSRRSLRAVAPATPAPPTPPPSAATDLSIALEPGCIIWRPVDGQDGHFLGTFVLPIYAGALATEKLVQKSSTGKGWEGVYDVTTYTTDPNEVLATGELIVKLMDENTTNFDQQVAYAIEWRLSMVEAMLQEFGFADGTVLVYDAVALGSPDQLAGAWSNNIFWREWKVGDQTFRQSSICSDALPVS